MPKPSVTFYLLALCINCCSAAPAAGHETKLDIHSATPSTNTPYFLLSPQLEYFYQNLDGDNASECWNPNKTYLDIHGRLTESYNEAAKFSFYGKDGDKLELLVNRNVSMAIGVDASLFKIQPLQPFHPIIFSGEETQSRGNFHEKVEKDCAIICKGYLSSPECLKCDVDLEVKEGFRFKTWFADDIDEVDEDEKAHRVHTQENALKARKETNLLKTQRLGSLTQDSQANCEEKHCRRAHAAILEKTCLISNSITSIPKRSQENIRAAVKCHCPVCYPNQVTEGNDSLLNQRDANSEMGRNDRPLLKLAWMNSNFKMTDDGLKEDERSVGYCVAGMGHAGAQVNVISPTAGIDVNFERVAVNLYPSFVDELRESGVPGV